MRQRETNLTRNTAIFPEVQVIEGFAKLELSLIQVIFFFFFFFDFS